MHQSSNEVEHPFLSFLYRLFALYWIVLFFFIPAYTLVHIHTAYQRVKQTESKYEKKFWRNRIRQDWCLLYISVCLYYYVFQDFIGMWFSYETRNNITWWFETVTGLPGVVWYIFTNRQVAIAGDADKFASFTIIWVLGFLIFWLLLDYMNVFGKVDVHGNYELPEKANKARLAKYERDEAPFKALLAERSQMQCDHPRNEPGWSNWSKAKQQQEVAIWEANYKALNLKIEQCPRASRR